MKNNTYLKLTFELFLLAALSNAQWSPDLRLTNNAGISIVKSDKSIASDGNYVHVIWSDDRNGLSEIYYKRSTNGGMNWGSDLRLTNAGGYSEEPSISVAGSVVHVAWKDYRDGNYEIYYKRSTNSGENWSSDTRITNNISSSYYPCIAAGDYVHLVWTDEPIEDGKIYYRRSTNEGVSWSTEAQISHGSNLQQSPSISVSGSYVHIVWEDQQISVINSEIYYRRSLNVGNSWGAETRLTSSSGYSEDPTVSSSGTDVHVSWYDVRDGNPEIYYKRSTDGGSNWQTDVRMTNNSYVSNYPSISVSGPIVHTVWYDDRNGNEEIYYKRSTNRGSTWGTDTRLTSNANDSRFPSVTFSGMVVHLAWADNRDGNWEIYYKRNPTGNPDAIKKISAEIPVKYVLYQNYPNPFNPVTKIKFEVPNDNFVEIRVFDVLGKEIAVLVREEVLPGIYEAEFEGAELPSGVYFYSLKTETYSMTKKMSLIK